MSEPAGEILDYTRRAPPPPKGRVGGGTLAAIVAVFILFTALGTLALWGKLVTVAGQDLSLRRSLFTAVNATTLTGFQQNVGSATLRADALLLSLTLGGTFFSLAVGGIAVARIARMHYSDGQVALGAGVATFAAMIAGASCLFGDERPLLASLLQATSAFGNSGLYAGRLTGPLDWQTHVVLLPLAFLGALGMPVLMELFDRVTGARRLSNHTKTVLVLAAGTYLAGAGLIWLLDAVGGAWGAGGTSDFRYAVASASMFSIDARTAGLPFDYIAGLARPAQWILVALMIVGGSPGGTAGGLKTTTVWRLFTGLRDNLRGRYVARSFGVAACWAASYFAIALVGFLLLLQTEPDISADRLLFIAFSAASNVGLSHDPISISGNGLFTVSAMMLAGRLAPLGVLWWVALNIRQDADDVAVG